MGKFNFENELNGPQWEAASTASGPLLILAGAGSGKTRVLTYRTAHLVATEAASPHEILAVTFTNKAAREMLERTGQLLQRIGVSFDSRNLWISTFHSSCARILRKHIDLLAPYDSSFAIYDDSDQISMLKRVCDTLNLNDKIYPAKSFQYHINQAKNQYLSPQALKGRRPGHFFEEKVGDVYAEYENQMRQSNALDFGDLIFKTVELFEKHPDVLEFYQERFKYLMVDEYQDTNRIQYILVHLIARKYRNLCVVGDEDQSIYSWRGADISNILNFEQDFPDAKIVKLEENYRSTKNIVEAASHVIKNNKTRKDKTLWTGNRPGEPILIREELNEQEEARNVVREIQASARDDQREFNEYAIFYRTNAQSRVLEDQLRSHQIPYRIIGGMKFYERAEIKDVLSYLKLLLNPRDNIGLKRIINSPPRGIGKTTVEKLEGFATQHEISLFEGILPALQEKLLDRGATKKVLDFYEMMTGLINRNKSASPQEAYHAVLTATQYVEKLKAEDNPEAQARIENLEELDTAISEFEKERGDEATLASFLEEVALATDVDRTQEPNPNSVSLMTLHLSKGLEFPVVFVVGLEEGLFPSSRDRDSHDSDEIEEERRLFYVGMTRAREKLHLSYARTRRVWGQEQMNPPSRFLGEIPETYIKKISRMRTPDWRAAAQSLTRQTPWTDESLDVPSYDEFDDDASFKKGMRVRHPSFGVGVIHLLEGHGEDQKVTILFPNNSLKKFVVKYARLERA